MEAVDMAEEKIEELKKRLANIIELLIREIIANEKDLDETSSDD